MSRRTVASALALALSGLPVISTPPPAPADPPSEFGAQVSIRVLVFHNQTDPAAAGVTAIHQLGRDHGFQVDDTADPAAFTTANLARYRAVAFLSGAGDALSADQEAAFRGYLEAGGGFVGIADAALTQPASTWFTDLIGSRPATSPVTPQQAVVDVADRVHPATRNLPLEWTRTDQWFNRSPKPVGTVHT